MTSSAYLQEVCPIIYRWEDDLGIDDGVHEEISELLTDIQDELRDRLDNIPYELQEGCAGQLLQERIDGLEYTISELDNISVEDLRQEIADDFANDCEDVDEDITWEWLIEHCEECDIDKNDVEEAFNEKYRDAIIEALENVVEE